MILRGFKIEKIAVIDCRADDKTVYTLEKLNIKVIPTLKIDNLYDLVATSTQIFKFTISEIIVSYLLPKHMNITKNICLKSVL